MALEEIPPPPQASAALAPPPAAPAKRKRDQTGRARPSREKAQALKREEKAARQQEVEAKQRAAQLAAEMKQIAHTASLPARVIAVTKRKEATEAEAADKHAIVDRFHEQQAAGEKVSWGAALTTTNRAPSTRQCRISLSVWGAPRQGLAPKKECEPPIFSWLREGGW